MVKTIAALSLVLTTPAFAGTLTCKLSDPKSGKEIEASIDSEDPNAVAITADEIGEISFNLDSPSCDKRGACQANITFNSSHIQDEVGSMTVEFSNRRDNDLVLTEPVNGEDGDNKPYSYILTCAYKNSPAPTAATGFVCVNKTDLKSKFNLSLDEKGGSLSGISTKCDARFIPYRPVSPKYQGWVRIAPLPKEKGCTKFYSEILGKPYDGDTADIHWLSISREMQAGQDGFAQLGVENTSDPGSGGTAKIFVRCFAKK